jgi:plasmid stabilization system protein ParE
MRCDVVIADEAKAQIQSISDWWTDNRPGGATVFLQELNKTIELLGHVPRIGSRFRRVRRPGLRRVLLRRSQHFVYYLLDERRSVVYVLAVWSTARGSDPLL